MTAAAALSGCAGAGFTIASAPAARTTRHVATESANTGKPAPMRLIASADGAAFKDRVGHLNITFADDGYGLPAVVRAIALSNAFSQIRTVEPSTKTADVSSSLSAVLKVN